MKVLIADDEIVFRKILQRTLEGWGYEVLVTENGAEAYQQLRVTNAQVAVLDWMMPEMDGLEVCRKLASLDRFIYVILLTGKQGPDEITLALDAGASDYLLKPFQPEALLARLKVAERISSLHMHIAQLQKLEAIGRLAAGVAHEINTPMQYIGDNTRFLQDAFADLNSVLEAYGKLHVAVQGQDSASAPLGEVDAALENADLEFLLEGIPKAIGQTLQGIEQVTRIVRAMKEFSHPGGTEKTPVDLNRAIESTLTVARNEWKYVADLETSLDPELPPVPCFPGKLNQAILNLVVNAAHAIGDVAKVGGVARKGVIRVSTSRQGEWAEIRIQDTGTGIKPEVLPRMFEPFFTTKEVGRGTGQGLSLTHAIVVEKHGGAIDIETEVGAGTTFILRLPLVDEPRVVKAA